MLLLSETSVVENASLNNVLAHCLEEFLELFSTEEKNYCFAKKKWKTYLAARFAAKHAVCTLLGNNPEIGWDSIHIKQSEFGAPYLLLTESAALYAQTLNVIHWQLSLTHTSRFAAAMVAAEVVEVAEAFSPSTSSEATS